MQLFYDCMFKNILNGLPICRPLFISCPRDKALFNDKECFISNEFFVGDDLLIAPILDPQIQNGVDTQGKRDVYLPTDSDHRSSSDYGCNWFTYMNNTQPLGDPI